MTQSIDSTLTIAGAAIAYEHARRIATSLKVARNGCRCDEAEADEPEVGYRGVEPCWKRWEDGVEDRTRAPETKWCGPCRLRQRFHEAYRVAAKIRGARMRAFQRAAAKAIDTQAIDGVVAEIEKSCEASLAQPEPVAVP